MLTMSEHLRIIHSQFSEIERSFRDKHPNICTIRTDGIPDQFNFTPLPDSQNIYLLLGKRRYFPGRQYYDLDFRVRTAHPDSLISILRPTESTGLNHNQLNVLFALDDLINIRMLLTQSGDLLNADVKGQITTPRLPHMRLELDYRTGRNPQLAHLDSVTPVDAVQNRRLVRGDKLVCWYRSDIDPKLLDVPTCINWYQTVLYYLSNSNTLTAQSIKTRPFVLGQEFPARERFFD